MGKYICLCGFTYKTKMAADIHVKMYQDLELAEGFPRHKIFKQHWQARLATWACSLATWACNYPWMRLMRFVGAYMIYFVLVRHFHIDWSLWEAALIGVGMGLYID